MAIRLRRAFAWPGKQTTHWFPGHMAKGLRLMQVHLGRVDCVLEVHDSRLSGRGRNPSFDLLAARPRVLVHTKADLAGLPLGRDVDGGGVRVNCAEPRVRAFALGARMSVRATHPRCRRVRCSRLCRWYIALPCAARTGADAARRRWRRWRPRRWHGTRHSFG